MKDLRECNLRERCELIRLVYSSNMERITSSPLGSNPYLLDWGAIFTPIEEYAWHAIRRERIPMYPQFPVGNYFIDFANPVLKVGLECDGKDWHDEEKDRARDEKLSELGWEIYRVTGSECVRYVDSPEDIIQRLKEEGIDFYLYWDNDGSEIHDWYKKTVEGLVRSIKQVYFMNEDEHTGILYGLTILLAFDSLEDHGIFHAGEIQNRLERKLGKYVLNSRRK